MVDEVKSKRLQQSTPSDGYVCKNCNIAGHWIQRCPKRRKKMRNSSHTPVAGVDPSQDDIERARAMQKIKPPRCFCGIPSRLKKVKHSRVNENSRAVGKYFFFCMKKKADEPCRFARPVDEEVKDKKDRLCAFFVKKGICKKGANCMFSHEVDDHIRRSWEKNANKKNNNSSNNDDDDDNKKDADGSSEKEQKKAKQSTSESNGKAGDEDGSSSDSDSSSSSSESENERKSSDKSTQNINDEDDGSSSSSSSDDSDDDDQV
eukprot:CAMPEP_0198119616 /NCGR_PEP_ID=MMETSP1442-20131203/26351_1 /TAXON_ID= /ORGANISM="Craspedostauros australis, Strain CCMP3328" /LENGTH=260 /DNA_ID=CAMNT_0043778127 /DNA_START=33 /DNA_END=812 /DNA_ORIENTATION=-